MSSHSVKLGRGSVVGSPNRLGASVEFYDKFSNWGVGRNLVGGSKLSMQSRFLTPTWKFDSKHDT